jgi:hypothetical protein
MAAPSFIERFVLPLVAGGTLHVAAPLGRAGLLKLRDTPQDPALVAEVFAARSEVANGLLIDPIAPQLDLEALRLAAASRLASTRGELVASINRDYAAFVRLSQALETTDASVLALRPPVARAAGALAALGAKGFDIVFDAVLGPGFRPAFERLAAEGRYVLYGAADFMPAGRRRAWAALAWRWLRRPRLDPLAMISDNRGLLAFNLIWLWESVERLPAAYAGLAALDLPPPHVGARYPFTDATTAIAELKAGRTIGKSVLLVS